MASVYTVAKMFPLHTVAAIWTYVHTISIRRMDAQGCPDLVAKQGKEGPWAKAPRTVCTGANDLTPYPAKPVRGQPRVF